MSRRFYNVSYRHHIYAIVSQDEDAVFVGKSHAKEPRGRYYAHLRGKYWHTKDDFGPGCYVNKPSFLILETIDCTGAAAFKHVVAWGHYFEEHGYALLAPRGTFNMTDKLLPETQKIYDAVCAPAHLEEVLDRTFAGIRPDDTHGAASPAPRLPPKPATVQLNVRVTSDTALSFREFCKGSGLTQNEGMEALLSAHNRSQAASDASPMKSLQRWKQLTRQREEDLARLRRDYADFRRKCTHLRQEQARVYRGMIKHIMDQSATPAPPHPPLKPIPFSQGQRSEFYRYHFPSETGCSIIQLDSLVYGKGLRPPLFVLGTTEDGTPVKLRWYPKAEYSGPSPKSEQYAYQGAQWLVGYITAADGAVDLISALPLDALMMPKKADGLHSALDDMIRGADARRMKCLRGC